jgi:uncharacterized protein YbcV (DUF1398 family)
MIDEATIHKILNSNIAFPEAVKRLSDVGIEHYYTDLFRMEKILYRNDGSIYNETISISNMPKVASVFNELQLKASLKSVQQGMIDYATFMRQIADSGVASYTVYISGKQVIYSGRKGEYYIEKFPNQKSV